MYDAKDGKESLTMDYEEEVCRGSGRKRKWEDILALAPDIKRLIKEAGRGQFAIQ